MKEFKKEETRKFIARMEKTGFRSPDLAEGYRMGSQNVLGFVSGWLDKLDRLEKEFKQINILIYDDRVIIKRETVREGEIKLKSLYEECEAELSNIGVVVAYGQRCVKEFDIGDKVLFERSMSEELKGEYIVIREGDIALNFSRGEEILL